MNKDIKKRWVEALRSGDYSQTKGRLRNGNSYCCIGVLADACLDGRWLAGGDIWQDIGGRSYNGALGSYTIDSIGIDYLQQDRLISMNDNGLSFEDIADYIEEYL